HRYVGTQCGIMDQFIAAFAQAGHALLIDCRSLEARPVAMKLAGCVMVVADSQVKHALASSAYNQRRAECARGVELLRAERPGLRALRDLSWEDFLACVATLPEPVRRRVRHVVSENRRTLAAVGAFEAGAP